MAQYGRPDSDIHNSGGFAITGGSNLYEVLDETSANDSDYINCPSAASTYVCEVGLSNVSTPTVDTGHVVRFRGRRVLGNGSSMSVALKQGSTTIASGSSGLLSTTATTYSFTLSEAEAANITDYTDLRLEVTANKVASNGSVYCSWLELETPDGGLTHYSLECAYNAFTFTGQSANLLAGWKAGAALGEFALSGQSANLLMGRKCTADVATFTFTGQDVTLTYTPGLDHYTLEVDTGSFTLTGQQSNFLVARKLALDYDSFALTGQAVVLKQDKKVSADTASFTLTGNSAGLTTDRKLSADSGSFTHTGQDISFSRTYKLSADKGWFPVDLTQWNDNGGGTIIDSDSVSFSASGQYIDSHPYIELNAGQSYRVRLAGTSNVETYFYDLNFGIVALIPNTGAFDIEVTAQPAYDFTVPVDNTPSVQLWAQGIGQIDFTTFEIEAVFDLQGQDANLLLGPTILPDSGTFYCPAQYTPVQLYVGRKVFADTDSFALTGQDVSFKRNYALSASSGSFTLSGQTAGLEADRTLGIETGSFTLTGQDAAFRKGFTLSAGQGSFTLTGQDVSFSRTYVVPASTGSFTFTGNSVTLTKTGSYDLQTDSGSFSLSGQDVSLKRSIVLACSQGSFTYSGVAAGLTGQRKVSSGTGSFSLTGQSAGLLRGIKCTASTGTYTFTGNGILFKFGRSISAGYGSFSLTGRSASLYYGKRFAADKGSFTLTGKDVGWKFGYRLVIGARNFTLSGQTALFWIQKQVQVTYHISVYETEKSVDLYRTGKAAAVIEPEGAITEPGLVTGITIYKTGHSITEYQRVQA